MQVTKTILLADDDDDLLASLSHRCSHLGLKVIIARTGFEALTAIRCRLPDMACLDVNMPFGDGLSLCQMLLTDQDSMHLPIIILTGRKDATVVRRCHELKAYYVLKGANVWAEIEPLLRQVLTSLTRVSAYATVGDTALTSRVEPLQPESD